VLRLDSTICIKS